MQGCARTIACAIGLSWMLAASDIEGSVVITRRLTKKKVTPSASSYSRGVSVDLRTDSAEEVLEAERSRVVIYLEGDRLTSKQVNSEIIQINRQFLPDTVTIPVHSIVSFPNQDPIFHNVFSLSKPKSFDLGNYPKGQTRAIQFSKPGIVFVHCHLHPNMSAAILIAPNRYTTVADKTGHFTLKDVPPGEYTAVAWHRGAGYFRQTVKVTARENGEIRFILPLEIPQPKPAVASR